MALCLKKLKNLAKVKLIDASFLWTEPHSKRIKIKLSIQVIFILEINDNKGGSRYGLSFFFITLGHVYPMM